MKTNRLIALVLTLFAIPGCALLEDSGPSRYLYVNNPNPFAVSLSSVMEEYSIDPGQNQIPINYHRNDLPIEFTMFARQRYTWAAFRHTFDVDIPKHSKRVVINLPLIPVIMPPQYYYRQQPTQ